MPLVPLRPSKTPIKAAAAQVSLLKNNPPPTGGLNMRDPISEMSLLDAGARFASCVTLSRCSLAVLAHSALDELAIEEPRLGMAVMSAIARRLSLRMRQLSARLGALLATG